MGRLNRPWLKRSSPSQRIARRRPRNITEYLQLPLRWRSVLAGFVLIIGFMLFLGLIADPSGTLYSPGVGATIFLVVVVVMALLLVYLDCRMWKRRGK
jgi:hypothetical protein